MDQRRNLDPQIVHDAAAYLFWTLAEALGINGATEAVIDSAGGCLLEQPFTDEVLGQYSFQKLPPGNQREVGSAIAAEAQHFAFKGENMNGVIYAEDAQNGRAPSANGVQTVHLRAIPRQVMTSGTKIEKIGRLCLRHPLPAVVFSEALPIGDVIEVADTSAALGFQLPMFLTNIVATRLGDELFVLTGILLIPVPDARSGNEWDIAIQNSLRFVDKIQFAEEIGSSTVVVEWQS